MTSSDVTGDRQSTSVIGQSADPDSSPAISATISRPRWVPQCPLCKGISLGIATAFRNTTWSPEKLQLNDWVSARTVYGPSTTEPVHPSSGVVLANNHIILYCIRMIMQLINQVITCSPYSTLFGRSTLLGTAVILLQSKLGQMIENRTLIDPTSKGTFVTESIVQSLRLLKKTHQISISGTGATVTVVAQHAVTLALRSKLSSNFTVSVSATVWPRLTSLLPRHQVNIEAWPHLKDLSFADRAFHKPGAVQCILGADITSCGTKKSQLRRARRKKVNIARKRPKMCPYYGFFRTKLAFLRPS